MNSKNISLQQASDHGIVTDQKRLLLSRHWASRLNLFSRKAATSTMLGNTRSQFRGRGMEFEEVRRYQPGDDIRSIDWRVTARANGTYTKLFREERERPCHLLVDQRQPMFFGSTGQFKSVLAAEIATALGWATLAAGDRVSAQLIGQQQELDLRSQKSRKALLGLINHLRQYNHQLLEGDLAPDLVSRNLSDFLEESRRLVRPGSAAFIISDFHDIDEACNKALSRLAKHTDITLIQITDPLEETMPLEGNLAVSDGIQISKIKFNKALRKQYRETWSKRQQAIRTAATQSGSHLLKISTDQNARKALCKVYQS